MSLLITCDTGGWRTPSRLRSHLAGTPLESSTSVSERLPSASERQPIVAAAGDDPLSRTGIDREAYFAARRLAHRSGASLVCNEHRSDLIDVGHSLHHRELFPLRARTLPPATRDVIIEAIYTPYRQKVERQILSLLHHWSYVVHLSIRTFDAKTSQGSWRRGDVGLLYDPSHPDEVDWCLDFIEELYDLAPDLKVRRNHPGRGTNDSLTKTMRSKFSQEVYLGIEVVLNRAWMSRPVVLRDVVLDQIGEAIACLTAEPASQQRAHAA